MTKNKNIVVQKSLLPFSNAFETLELEKCRNIQAIVDKLTPFNFVDCKIVVTKNGVVIPEENWKRTRLKKGDIVGVNVIPQGGGNNKGNWVQLFIASIVIAVGSITLNPYVLSAGVSMGISGAVGLISNALMKTPKQTEIKSATESNKNFIEGATNEIKRFGVIPINLGTNRMFPCQAALPYVETSGNNQYCRQLFTYGYGKVVVTDRKLGETDLSSYSDVELEDKLDGNLNSGLKLYSNDVYEEQLSINLTNSGGAVVRTTQPDCDECEIDITFQGLIQMISEGKYAGMRLSTSVDFEIQYAPTGTENWSTGLNGQKVAAQSLTGDFSTFWVGILHHKFFVCRAYFVILNVLTGKVRLQSNDYFYVYGVNYPSLSADEVILGYYNNGSYVDARAGLVGKHIKSMNDFVVTINNSNIHAVKVDVGAGEILGTISRKTVTASTTQALRKTFRFKFPQTGQYDIRIRRLTSDSSSEDLINKSYLTALRSISYKNPVNFADISGTAMRIKATDQLNGSVDSYNCLVSTLVKGYDPESKTWVDNKISSNPADLFRYVLQSPAFAKYREMTDDRIDLEKLAEWWVYCDENKLTFDKIIDYDTSIDDVLNDICAAGVATISKSNNIYSVIIDNERPIVKGLVTPRNSWDYKGTMNYPEIPHALRVEFRNADKGYNTDERIVYADGYNEKNATLYERLEFSSCTDADLAYWYGRRYLATALLQPETHTFKMDFEYMTFNRGDRINLVNDVILVGVGQGRIKQLLVDNPDNPTVVNGFVIDDKIEIPNANNFAVRIRDNDAKQGYTYHLLTTTEGTTDTFVFATPVSYDKAPAIESLCAFVEDGKELDLIITGITVDKNMCATITAIDYAPARFDPLGDIPEFVSNITIDKGFYKPYAPELMTEVKSDESVMIRNSDGSLISVMVIELINRNEEDIGVNVKCRRKGETEWFVPSYVKKDASQLLLTGLYDGEYYDIEIRYQRQTGLQLASDALLLENIKFIGGSNPPQNVKNFRVTVTNGLALFEWAPNDDIDISHYVIRFSADLTDVTWEGSQVAMDKITSTSITNIIHKGVYLIKAVDLLGNESPEATTIVSIDSGAFNNVVEELTEDPTWQGKKDNVIVINKRLSIDDDTKTDGYYYFSREINLGDVYECSLRANVKSSFEKRDRIRDIDYIRDVDVGLRDYGVDWEKDVDWSSELEMSVSMDGKTWGDWEQFIASQLKFYAIKFRLHLYSGNVYTTPRVSIARVTVDMPDRYESAEDVEIVDANIGAVVKYSSPFRNNPAVNITIQDGAVDDRIEFTVKNNEGFTFKVFNATLNTYVKRSFDYLAAGYGKVTQ